jgi:hypothetical protein
MESSRVNMLLAAVLLAGCATAAPQALSPQLEEHQRLANALHPRVQVQGGWAPEDNLGVVQTVPFSGRVALAASASRSEETSSAHRAANT